MSTIREPPRTHEDLLGARGLGFGKEFGKQGKWVLAVFVPTQLEKEKKKSFVFMLIVVYIRIFDYASGYELEWDFYKVSFLLI